MASDTVPAAAPSPADPPPSTAPTAPTNGGQQQPGGLAGLLAPIQPTRTAAFNLDPAAAALPGEEPVTGAASSTWHTDDNNPADTSAKAKNNAAGKQQTGVVKAWLLAGAERWRKGGDARLKALDVRKAKAQARQVKENVTVNRAEKIVGGSTNSSTGSNNGAGKSLTNKSAGSGTGPKKNNHNQRSGSGSGGSGGGSGSGGRNSADGPAGRTPKNSTGTGGAGGRKDSASKGARTDHGGRKAPHAAPQTSGKTGVDSGAGTKQDKLKKKPKSLSSTTCGDTGAARPGPPGKNDNAAKTPPKPSPDPASEPRAKDSPVKPATGAADPVKTGTDKTGTGKGAPKNQARPDDTTSSGPKTGDSKTDKTGKKPDSKKTTDSSGPNTQPSPIGKDTAPAPTTRTPKPRINLQKSRETGYRDGTLAGKAAAHVKAYRDGTRDGWTDIREAADRETHRLDQAHTARRKSRSAPDKDQPVTQTATSADYHPPVPPKPDHAPGPQPVPVASIDATHVHLGDGAARTSISRGEVRTLRRFQQRLESKTDRMTTIGEATRTLEQHANEQAKQVTTLLEQARGVEGGEKLVSALAKLADAAQVQATKAAEINKRAVRAGEACKALHSNTEARYGGIYQAVIDAPEPSPAVMTFYQEMGHANA